MLRLYSYHKGFVKILLQTLVAILGVVSRKSPFRSMLSSSLIGELRASFVVPINEYCLLVIYMFCSQPPAVSPFMLFDIFPLRPPLGTFCPKVCLKAALKQFTTWTKYTEELYYCTKSSEFWFIWLVDLHGNLDVWRWIYHLQGSKPGHPKGVEQSCPRGNRSQTAGHSRHQPSSKPFGVSTVSQLHVYIKLRVTQSSYLAPPKSVNSEGYRCKCVVYASRFSLVQSKKKV